MRGNGSFPLAKFDKFDKLMGGIVPVYNLLPLGLFNTVLGLLATSLDQAYSQHIPIFTAS